MFWIALSLLLLVAGWMWVRKPPFPSKLFFNAEPIVYESSPKRWIVVYSICLALLILTAVYQPLIDLLVR